MFKFLKNFLDYNEKELNRIRKKLEEINRLEDEVRNLADKDFPEETAKLKKLIQSGEKTLDDILPRAFALVREASRRVLGQRHFDVQLIAGVALHEGKIAEQKTGEGKTLSATTALYLNSLTGKGVHLVTVNDYLVRRDAGWMGGVFNFLGASTAAIISESSFIYDPEYIDSQTPDWRLTHLRPVSRREAYLADITYGINSEFGFDYLRDNMAASVQQISQREFYYAIIDEADSVLIDEARTPHIISAPYEQDTSRYYQYAALVKQLAPEKDFVIDEKARTANLTEEGIMHIEKLIGVVNIYEKNFDTLFHIEAALKAETLFKIDKEYIVKEGEVIIVDEFTGRLLQGRRFSEGIHQAIEAKENVPIQKESKTLATISLQNYFRKYEKLAGMTGTAATEAEEFQKIYKTDVLVIPTHMQMIRQDDPDMVYKTEKGKYNAIAEEAIQQYKIGRPVLIGTTSIDKNEHIARLLTQKGVPHQVLNAKNHEKEAQIIAEAGEKGAITVATNMAGRGVDIVLGGEQPSRYETQNKDKKNKSKEKDFDKQMLEWEKRHDEVVSLGGLYIIGTERHESRRIDNQLRGRAGRQGDPGKSRFFVSLEDDLMRIFGGEQISKLMGFFNLPEDQPLTHSMVSKAIEQAQVKVEGFNFDTRKHLVDFDDVLNKQREIVYDLRRKILILPEQDMKMFKETVFETFNEEIQNLINRYPIEEAPDINETIDFLDKELNLIIPVPKEKISQFVKEKNIEGLVNFVTDLVQKEYAIKEKKFGQEIWNGVVRAVFLSTIDMYLTEHLTAIEDLREGINLRGYAQLDPLVEYKNDAYSMFEKLLSDINFEIIRRIFRMEIESAPTPVQVEAPIEREKPDQENLVYKSAAQIDPYKQSPAPQHLTTSEEKPKKSSSKATVTWRTVTDDSPPPAAKKQKLGRNDPCWCGSGRKYKKCHYPD